MNPSISGQLGMEGHGQDVPLLYECGFIAQTTVDLDGATDSYNLGRADEDHLEFGLPFRKSNPTGLAE